MTVVGALAIAIGGSLVLSGPSLVAFADGPVACGPLTQPPDPGSGFCADYNGANTWYGTYGPGLPTPQGYGFCADQPASGGWFPVPAYNYTPGSAPAGSGGDTNALGFAFSQGQAAGWWGGSPGLFNADQAAAAAKILYDTVVWGSPTPSMDPNVMAAYDDFDGLFIQAKGMSAGSPQMTASLTSKSTTFTTSATDQIHVQFPGTNKPFSGAGILLSIKNGTFNSATGPTSIGAATDGNGDLNVNIYATNGTPIVVTVSAVSSMGVAGINFWHPAAAYSAAQIMAGYAAPKPVGLTQLLTSAGVPKPQTGTVSVQKAGNDEAYYGVAGAVFDVDQAGTTVATLTTAANGATQVSNAIPVGTYTVSEATPPSGYTTAPSQTVTVVANQNTVVSFTGTDQELIKPATLSIHKADAQGAAPLAGAEFAVSYSTANNADFDQNLGTCTTDALGTCSPTGNDGADLLPGNYEIKEIAAPPGYYLDPTTALQSVTLTPGESGSVTFADSLLGSLNLNKTGDDTAYQSVTGAVFTLSGPVPSPATMGTLTIGPSGMSNTLTGLTPGTYSLAETTPPPGYQAIAPTQIAVTDGHATTTVDVMDHAVPAALSLLKVDRQTNAPLAGAVLHITYDPTDTGTYSQDLGTCTTTSAGLCAPTGDDGPDSLLPGNYRVTEVSAPTGYQINPSTASQDITLAAGMDGSLTFSDSLLVGAQFQKVATGNVNSAEVDLTGATLAVHQGSASGPVVATCSTDSTGSCLTNAALVSGSPYCWVETAAPAGLSSGASGCFTATNAQADEPITVDDAGLFVAIAVKKVDAANTATSVPGAVFNLYRNAGTPTSSGSVMVPPTSTPPTPADQTPTTLLTTTTVPSSTTTTTSRSVTTTTQGHTEGQRTPRALEIDETRTLVAQATTASDGIATFPLQLPGYSYCAVEEQAPANYVLNSTPQCTNVLTGSATVPPPVNTLTVTDTEATLSLQAHKFNVQVPDTSIPGATYDLYAEGSGPPASPVSQMPSDAAKVAGDTWFGRGTSDARGNLSFTIPAGYAWCLLEHAAPLNYMPDTALHCTSVLNSNATEAASTVALPETLATVYVTAHKYNTLQPDTVIPGATYELVVQGPTPAGFSPPAAPAGDSVPQGDVYWATGTTTSAGLLSFAVPAGYSWCLHEVSPPPGYQPDASFHCTAVLTSASPASAESIALPEMPISNSQTLAFTGGPSLWFAIGGALLILGGLGLLLLRRRLEGGQPDPSSDAPDADG